MSAYHQELVELFTLTKGRLPSYSMIRRVLLNVDYEQYSACLAKFFEINPRADEMLAVDGKCLRGPYQLASDHSTTEPHPAIQLVSVYLVERGLILEPYEVERKSNEIKVLTLICHSRGRKILTKPRNSRTANLSGLIS